MKRSERAILAVLNAHGESFAPEIAERSAGLVTRAGSYAYLAGLVRLGFVSRRVEAPKTLPNGYAVWPRTAYSITDAGREALAKEAT